MADDIGPGKKMRDGETEYGGRRGRIQASLDGHEPNTQEKAAIQRAYGIRNPSGELGQDGLPWAEGVERLEETKRRVSGRELEEGL